MNEVHCPGLVRSCGQLPILAQLCLDLALRRLVPQLQAHLAVQPVDPLRMHSPPFAIWRRMKAICASLNFDLFMILPRTTARITHAALAKRARLARGLGGSCHLFRLVPIRSRERQTGSPPSLWATAFTPPPPTPSPSQAQPGQARVAWGGSTASARHCSASTTNGERLSWGLCGFGNTG